MLISKAKYALRSESYISHIFLGRFHQQKWVIAYFQYHKIYPTQQDGWAQHLPNVWPDVWSLLGQTSWTSGIRMTGQLRHNSWTTLYASLFPCISTGVPHRSWPSQITPGLALYDKSELSLSSVIFNQIFKTDAMRVSLRIKSFLMIMWVLCKLK